ncbi:MAG: hypothetical protein U0793_09495 [Gemmataceae bacterium]
MPLTKEERAFLDAYVWEATHEPFGGPAASDLRGRDIYYPDLHGLLTAYHREMQNEQAAPFGKRNPCPPACPWRDRGEVDERGRMVMEETSREKGAGNGTATASADSVRG